MLSRFLRISLHPLTPFPLLILSLSSLRPISELLTDVSRFPDESRRFHMLLSAFHCRSLELSKIHHPPHFTLNSNPYIQPSFIARLLEVIELDSRRAMS